MRYSLLYHRYSNAFTGVPIKSKAIIRIAPLLMIKGYQCIVSPIIGPACRFTPSCSEYAYLAISRYGLFKGAYLAGRRLLRCHPFHPGGIDPVP